MFFYFYFIYLSFILKKFLLLLVLKRHPAIRLTFSMHILEQEIKFRFELN